MSTNNRNTTIIILITMIAIAGLGIIIGANSQSANTHTTSNNATTVTTSNDTIAPQEIKTEVKIETKVEPISFDTQTIEDDTLEYGKTAVKTTGSDGETTYTYKVEYKNGKEFSRELISKEITKQPVTKVVSKGTKIIWHCTDSTSYDKNPYNDNRCTSSTGEVRYVSDSQSRALDPTYTPGKAGHWYYNSK